MSHIAPTFRLDDENVKTYKHKYLWKKVDEIGTMIVSGIIGLIGIMLPLLNILTWKGSALIIALGFGIFAAVYFNAVTRKKKSELTMKVNTSTGDAIIDGHVYNEGKNFGNIYDLERVSVKETQLRPNLLLKSKKAEKNIEIPLRLIARNPELKEMILKEISIFEKTANKDYHADEVADFFRQVNDFKL